MRGEYLQVLVGGHWRVSQRDISFKSPRLTVALDSSQKEQKQCWHRQLDKLWNREAIGQPRQRGGVNRQETTRRVQKRDKLVMYTNQYDRSRSICRSRVDEDDSQRGGKEEGIGRMLIILIIPFRSVLQISYCCCSRSFDCKTVFDARRTYETRPRAPSVITSCSQTTL